MTNCALILIASLPTVWLIVGCLLIVITLIAVVLFLVKAREVAVLKKEVMEVRETMRMMRYEEISLSRMLHTADKSATLREDSDEQPELAEFAEETIVPVEEPSSVLSDEPADEPAEEPAPLIVEEQDGTPEEEEPAEDPAMEEVGDETVEEPAIATPEEEVEVVAAPAEAIAASVEEETVEEEAVEEETGDVSEDVPGTPSGETAEETVENTAEEVVEDTPEEEEVAEEATVEESEEAFADEVSEEIPVLVPSGKQPINERRPAIPNDLFAAWFEENEPAEPEAPALDVVAVEEPAVVEESAPQQPVSAPEPVQEETVVSDIKAEPAATPALQSAELAEEKPASEPVEASDAAPAIVLSKEDERFCRKLERIVDTRMRNPNLNIDVIAAQFGIGRTNFYRKVRELMGMLPNDYLRKCRMDRAAELLRTTDLPVSDVCVQIGVPDAQYFSRVFKTFYGVTPTAYREQA